MKRTRTLMTGAAALLTAATVVSTLSAATDARPPRIVAAAMLDTDRDSLADGLRLTYSEPVRHAADRDGRYPFRVAGYAIRSVGRANGKTILLAVVEPATADDAVRPALSYGRLGSGLVLDRAGNRAVAQVFRSVRAHGNRPAPTPPPPPPPPPPPADRDGDGVVDAQDCAPADPAIKPGAPDEPDLAFVDTNCDGIDGNEKSAIFVSPLGKDTNPGTKAAPKREIRAAVVAAAAAGKDVYAAAGSYARVELVTGVDVFGGYDDDDRSWGRGLSPETVITGSPEGVFASGVTKVVLQLLNIQGLSDETPGASVYGIRAINGSKLTLQRVTIRSGNGSNGAAGTDGKPGQPGGPGVPGANGSCGKASFNSPSRRAPGGPGAFGRDGGFGGQGGLEDKNGESGGTGKLGTPGGSGGAWGNPGKRGRVGLSGAPGAPGRPGDGGASSIGLAAQAWRGVDGSIGQFGTPGMGGGGGGGGGGQSALFVVDGVGNGGGGGGGAGGPGERGSGGGFGGGSFGVYLHNSTLVAQGGAIRAGKGGAGGAGGRGGTGGLGGDGGPGGTTCTSEVGAGGGGGKGGAGGTSGGGGGGAGGPSIGVLRAGTSAATLGNVTIQVGTPGAGGATGIGGVGPGKQAEPGVALPAAG